MIAVYVQTDGSMVEPTSLQLITKARAIANGQRVVALLPTSDADQTVATVKQYGPDEILVLADDRFAAATDTELADGLYQVVEQVQPNSMLIPATVVGRSVAPRLQAKLQTGLTADCLDVYFDGDTLVQVKPTYGDDIMCEIICADRRPQMATVRPNVFQAEPAQAATQVTNVDFEFHPEAHI